MTSPQAQSKLPDQLGSNLEWQAWGEKDPLFGVIPQPGRERDGSQPWTERDFYETGRADWEELSQRWRRYGLIPDTCVEIGCGAGRLTRFIADTFSRVHGVDVAEGMIAYARERMPMNVELHVTNGVALPVPDTSITGVFSVIVFLHFDRKEHAAAYFREMARALKPGGTIMIQLPLHSWPPNTKPVMRRLYSGVHDAYMALRRLKGRYHRYRLARKQWSPFMQSMSYDTEWLQRTLEGLGFRDIETCAFRLTRGGAVYSWVFARKV